MYEGTARTRLEFDSEDDRMAPLRRQLGVSTFGLNLIRFRPGQRGRIHRHREQEEVYIVLEGTLSLQLEDEETTLGPNEAIRVAPNIRRQLTNRGPGDLLFLALGGSGEHDGRDGEAFTS